MSNTTLPRKTALVESELSVSAHRQKSLDAIAAAEESRLGQGDPLLTPTALLAVAQIHATLALSAAKEE